MGQLIKINRKLKQPVFVSTVKGFGQYARVTCQMDGWLCGGVPGLHFSVGGPFSGISLGMFSTVGETMVQVSEYVSPSFFSPLFFGNDGLLRVQSSVRDMLMCMSGSLLNLLLHACVGLLHQYMWTSFVCAEVSHLQSFSPSLASCRFFSDPH